MKTLLITAIAGITLIEIIALLMGINGTLHAATLAAITGLVGWSMPQLKLTGTKNGR